MERRKNEVPAGRTVTWRLDSACTLRSTAVYRDCGVMGGQRVKCEERVNVKKVETSQYLGRAQGLTLWPAALMKGSWPVAAQGASIAGEKSQSAFSDSAEEMHTKKLLLSFLACRVLRRISTRNVRRDPDRSPMAGGLPWFDHDAANLRPHGLAVHAPHAPRCACHRRQQMCACQTHRAGLAREACAVEQVREEGRGTEEREARDGCGGLAMCGAGAL